jgi:hypothetical protein
MTIESIIEGIVLVFYFKLDARGLQWYLNIQACSLSGLLV